MQDIYEGLTLMLVGMGTVFSFLTLLVLCIFLTSKFINRFWPEEITSEPLMTDGTSQELTAVISSAVHQYRKNHR